MEIPADSVFFSVATGEGHGSPNRNENSNQKYPYPALLKLGFGFGNHGKGGSGYKSEKGTGTFETLYSKDAPEGDAYLKWSPGQLDDKLVQHLVVGDDFDPEPGFQIDTRLKALSQSGEEIRK